MGSRGSVDYPKPLQAKSILPVLLLSLLLVSACGITSSADDGRATQTVEEDRAERAAERVRAIMDEVEALIPTDSELAFEWLDLSDDVDSALDDLMDDRSSVDTDGLLARIQSFAARLGVDDASEEAGMHLQGAFETFIAEINRN